MNTLKRYNSLICFAFSFSLYFFIAFFLDRTEFGILVFCWVSLFTFFYFFIKNNQLSNKSLLILSIVFRVIFLFSIPNLSQDFYRFIWDGRMIFEGFNPYLYLPETFITEQNYPVNEAKELYKGMGTLNGSHYTNYPPINQLWFLIGALFSNNSILGAVVVLRSLIIFADIGIIQIGTKLLQKLNLDTKNIYLYALNPFIIIELTGNLHFEPVMLFFLVWALYKLHQQKWIISAILIALSVSAKLIPLFFLPLFFQWFTHKKTTLSFYKLLLFYGIIITTTLILFLPFYSNQLISNYTDSVGLWFKNFEFNASFYYIFREIGYLFRGYNEIAIIGKILPTLSVTFLLILTFLRDNKKTEKLITAMLFSLSFYYFMSTTVHPWYLATLIILSVFTRFKFPIIWSIAIILSYQTYANTPWKENLTFVFFEYLILFSYLVSHLVKLNGKNCYEKEKEVID